jgi:hypothetical protein
MQSKQMIVVTTHLPHVMHALRSALAFPEEYSKSTNINNYRDYPSRFEPV